MKKIIVLCCLLAVPVSRGHATYSVPTNDFDYYLSRGLVGAGALLATGISAYSIYLMFTTHKWIKCRAVALAKAKSLLATLEQEIENAMAGGAEREGLQKEWECSYDSLQKLKESLGKAKLGVVSSALLAGASAMAAGALFYFLYSSRIPKDARVKIQTMHKDTEKYLRYLKDHRRQMIREKSREFSGERAELLRLCGEGKLRFDRCSLKLRAAVREMEQDAEFGLAWHLGNPDALGTPECVQKESLRKAIAAIKEEQPRLPSRVRHALPPIIEALEDIAALDTKGCKLQGEVAYSRDKETGKEEPTGNYHYTFCCYKDHEADNYDWNKPFDEDSWNKFLDETYTQHEFDWDKLPAIPIQKRY